MSEKLYLNNVLIQLPDNSIKLSFQTNDLADLKDRQAHYTNNIKIPFSPTNIKTMDFLGVTGSGSETPYIYVVAKYVVDGLEIIVKGTGKLKKSSGFYSLVIYSGNNSLLDLLGETELQTLDFSSYDHNLSNTSMISSFSNTSGYIYCLGKYWEGTTAGEFATNVTTPSFYVHTLWDMIFADIGKTTSGSFLSTSEFKSRVISMSKGYDRDLNNAFTVSYTATHTPTLDNITDDTGTSASTNEYLIDTFTSTEEKPYLIIFSGSIEVIDGENVKMIIKLGGVEVDSIDLESGDIFISKHMELNNGEIVNVYIKSTSTLSTATNYFNNINPDFITQIQKSFSFVSVKIGDIIGSTSRKEFVKDIMQRFGLMFRQVGDDYEFIRIKDLLTDKTGAEDWSDKFSQVQEIDYTPKYGQINYLKYQYDDTDTSQTFADGEIILDNYNLPQSKTMLTSIYKASNLEGSTNILKHWTGEAEGVKNNDDGLRIFKLIYSTDSVKYKFNHDAISTLNYTGTHPILTFSPLYYQSEINNYYLEFQSMFNRYKSYTLMMKLSLIDVLNVDFHKLKYIKQLGQFFYLNKISNFTNKKETKVQLIQIGADVIDPVSMQATSNGSSTITATLDVLDGASMEGLSSGSSIVTGGITVVSTTAVNSFDTSKSGASSSGGTCLVINWTRYHDGAGFEPVGGDLIYDDSAGSTLFNGGSLWYGVNSANTIQINSVGLVLAVTSCTPIVT